MTQWRRWTRSRSSIRNLLKLADAVLCVELRAVLSSDDDYASSSKPQIDWDDTKAQQGLIDSRAKDGYALHALLQGRELEQAVSKAAALLATVLGQDLETGDDGTFRIARRVAPDRVISVVDPETRHGHKTSSRGFDGYKGHAAINPDTEIITAVALSPGNAGDASVAKDLIADLLEGKDEPVGYKLSDADEPVAERATVYGDAAYGTGELQSHLFEAGIDSKLKTQPPSAKNGLYTKDRFVIDLDADTVTCPAQMTVKIGRLQDGTGVGKFGAHCAGCPLKAKCTPSGRGRKVRVGLHEVSLSRARVEQTDPKWRADYRATRPKVERKLAHLMRRRHGGRRARVRGKLRVGADFSLLSAAVNLARLATLRVSSTRDGGWMVAR